MRVSLVVLALLAAACSPPPGIEQQEQKQLGGDQDAHGCRASAGYSWCPATGQCERPWELAQARGFEPNEQAFKTFCRQR